jgi:hypothetical protein
MDIPNTLSLSGVEAFIAMHRKLTLVLIESLLTISLAVLTGCAGVSTSAHPANLSVTAIVPASGATQVATTTAIQVTFSAPVNSTTVSSTNITLTDPNPVAGTVTYNATTNTATFTPAAALASNTTFTVTVSGVTSSSGATMAASFTATFTTVPTTASSGTTQYQASLFTATNDNTPPVGQVSVDTSGNVTVQLTSAAASTSYTVQFCPAYNGNSTITYSCFTVGTVSTDASGNASATMAFPQSGSWAGDFELLSGTTIEYQTDVIANNPSQVYMSTLQPVDTVNGKGVGSTSGPQGPLTSGTVTLSNGTSLQFVLTGASPNTTYTTAETTNPLGSSNGYELYNSQGVGGFTTNGSGDVTFTVLQDDYFGDMFEVFSPTAAAGYIGGFSVP